MSKHKTLASPAAELLEFAQLTAANCGTWEQFHNAIFGIGGKMIELFPDQSDRIAFSKSPEFKQIQEIQQKLQREYKTDVPEVASGKFNLRIPESMHAALIAEAEREGVSLNQLCVAKLAVQLRASVR